MWYCAESESGEMVEDPSEDALYELISELAEPDNTFIVIERPENDAWHCVVTLLEGGGFEIEYRDQSSGEHRVESSRSISGIALSVTHWLAGRR